VQAIARPSSGSEIHIEVWLPEKTAWNGKLLGVGNGGYTGRISYGALENGIVRRRDESPYGSTKIPR
jgi:feruloyl esterase